MQAWIWGITALTVFFLALAARLIWVVGARSQRPRRMPNASEPGIAVPWRPLSFRSGDSRLEGWLLLPWDEGVKHAGSHKPPLVIVAHGWSSNRTRVLRYAEPLCESGFAVLMYDARSHGDSEAIHAPSAFMFRDDMLAAVDYAKSLTDVDTERIAVLGHSLGGFGALLALDEGLNVSAIVTDSMPVRFETMMKAELERKGLPLFPLAALIPRIWLIRAGITREQFRKADIPGIVGRYAGESSSGRVPVLMVHSTGDTFIPPDDLRELAGSMPAGTIETLFVAAEGHSASQSDPAFWKAVLPFLAKAFCGRTTAERMQV